MIRVAAHGRRRLLMSSSSASCGRSSLGSLSPGCSIMSPLLDDSKKSSNNKSYMTPILFTTSRGFATTGNDNNKNDSFSTSDPTPSFDDTMTKIFSEQDASLQQATETGTTTLSETAAAAATSFDPTWYNLADQAINAVNLVHETTGLSYGWSIVVLTTTMRVLMVPLFVKTQRNSSRMAHLQPEMQIIKEKLERLGPNPDQETQVKYGLQMKALFKKYDCNPLGAMALPFLQAPIFMGMFFGLRKMPTYFEEQLSTGGMLWFPDLTMSDPLYILPIGSALSFLIMIELGKDQMMATNPQQGIIMMNVFRSMSLVMIPVAINFSSAILCYWVTNNTFSLLQSMAFRNSTLRKTLDIWDPPKPVPGINTPKSISDSIQEVIDKTQGKATSDEELMELHNAKIETKKKASVLRKGGRNRKRRGPQK